MSLMSAKDRKPMTNQQYEAQKLLLCLREPENLVDPLNFPVIMDLPENSSFFHCDKYRLSSFPELFLPISTLLLEVAQQDDVPVVLQNKFREVSQHIKTS